MKHRFTTLDSFRGSPLSWNYPSWSISAEIVAYIAFCISIVYIRKFGSGYPSGMFLGISLLPIITIRLIFNSLNIELTNNYSILRCIFGFFIGCFTYEMYNQIAVGSANSQQFTLWEILALSVSLLATMYLPEDLNFVLPVFYAGTLSYSIYMTHAAVAVVFDNHIKSNQKELPRCAYDLTCGVLDCCIFHLQVYIRVHRDRHETAKNAV